MFKRNGIVLAVVVGMMGAFATSAAPPSTPAPAGFAIKGDVENGKKLFVANCAACHGKHGAGDGIAGKALTPPPPNFNDPKRFGDVTDWELFYAVKSGGAAVKLNPAMPAWSPALKDSEIEDVVAYVKASFVDAARKKAAPATK